MDQWVIKIDDFHNICRICLQMESDMLQFCTKEINEMIEACTPSHDLNNDKLPENICRNCYQELKTSYKFRKKYDNAVGILMNILLKSEEVKTEVTKFEAEEENTHLEEIEDGLPRSETECDDISGSELKNVEIKQKNKTSRIKKNVKEKDCVCDVCGKTVKKKKYLKIHKLSHSDVKPFKCNICNKPFKHSFTLASHMKVKHEHPNLKGVCFICGKLMKPKSLRYHLLTHEPVTTKYKCDVCERIYLREELLNRHIQEKHTSPIREKKVYCDVCNKCYSSKICLAKHKAYMHTERKKYDCTICGKLFSHPTNVTVHVNAAHKDLRPYVCDICTKAFHTKALLAKHVFSHSGERPHKCSVCGKAFGFKNVLYTHMKLHNKVTK